MLHYSLSIDESYDRQADQIHTGRFKYTYTSHIIAFFLLLSSITLIYSSSLDEF